MRMYFINGELIEATCFYEAWWLYLGRRYKQARDDRRAA